MGMNRVNEIIKDKKLLLTLVGLVIFSLIFKSLGLLKLPIFADEAIYIRWAQVMKAEETLRFLPLSDGKQPLFMWLTIPFLKLFSDPLMAGRMLSVLSGAGILIGVFTLTFMLSKSKKVSIAASLIYLFSPFTFFFDRMALVDSLLSFFGVWTVILCILTVEYKRLDLAMIAGFFLGGALLTKSPALFFALLIPVLVLFSSWNKNLKDNLRLAFKLGLLYLVIYLIGYGLYNILRLGPNFHLIASRNQDYVFPISHIFTDPWNPFFGNFNNWLTWIWDLAPAPIILLLPFSVYYLFRKNKKALICLLILILAPLIAQFEFAKVFTARYAFFTIPLLAVFSSYTFVAIDKKVKILIQGFLIIFLAFSLIQDFYLITNTSFALLPREERAGYLENWTAGTGIKEAANFLRTDYNKNPNNQIIVGTEGYFGTLPDGLEIYLNDIPQIKIIGVGLNLAELPKSLEESKKFGNKTYLLINDTRLSAEPEKIGLSLLKSYPKAQKPDGKVEHLELFEVK